jgi:predicted GNAT family acetyltransferase
MLTATHYTNATDFLRRAGPVLQRDEVRHGLILGVSARVKEDPHEYGAGAPWFLTLDEEGKLAALALRTPPFDLIVADFSGDAAGISRRLLPEVAGAFSHLPGVLGEPEIADAFAREWCAARGVTIDHTMRQRVYGLASVNPVRCSPGKMRQASADDIRLAVRWVRGFYEDVFGHVDEERAESRVATMLERGEIYFWEDGEPVSMAATARPVGKVITVSAVYTPPEWRNRGYATSCVATLCGRLLKAGYRRCTLYTDLDNPTSNKIYKDIGFTEVCDSVNHAFSPQG